MSRIFRVLRFAGSDIGAKAKNLRFLKRNGYDIPLTYVCRYSDDYNIELLKKQITKTIGGSESCAVRSSANIEDDSDLSFAGQFKSILDVKGVENIVKAIDEVRASAYSTGALKYMEENKIDPGSIKMAVIVQHMVNSKYSGISFSKNPLTGLTEIIIEACSGRGDNIIAKGFSPHRWIQKWDTWIQQPANSDIPADLITEVAEKTKNIAKKFKKAVDIEWAYDGSKLYFLQVRPITTSDIPIYSNRISKEMLPGIIKPLVWSVNTGMINKVWVNILRTITGEKSIKPEELTGQFYYRSYFNMAAFGRIFERFGMPYESMELMMGLVKKTDTKSSFKPGVKLLLLLPRITLFILSLFKIGNRLDELLLKKDSFTRFGKLSIEAENSSELLGIARQTAEEMSSVIYLNIIIPMLAGAFDRMLSGMLKKEGIDSRKLELAGLSSITLENSPHANISLLHNKYFSKSRILSDEESRSLEEDVAKFIENFGHYSDSSNDFSKKPWRENHEIIYSMIKDIESFKNEKVQLLKFEDQQIGFFKKPLLKYLYKKVCRFAVYREKISSFYTSCYGQFRIIYLLLGKKLKDSGLLNDEEDIFYLYKAELELIAVNDPASSVSSLVSTRKAEIESKKDATLPEIIFGNSEPPITKTNKPQYSGIPASLGLYTGTAKVLRGIFDYPKMKKGDVLIIPYSDVGWTPLFAKAGAVIAESGGLLSHSSIVAREYGIPAVLSVNNACCIPDDTIVTVNGYNGEIIIKE